MNKKLTTEIVKHILSGFLSINSDKYKSIISSEFLLSKKLLTEEDGIDFEYEIWGCQTQMTEPIKCIIMNCSSSDKREYCLIISIHNYPTYGVYIFSDLENEKSLISVSIDKGKTWMPCQIYLQATFLAAMEQLKDNMFVWEKCKEFDQEYECLKSFFMHKEELFEV